MHKQDTEHATWAVVTTAASLDFHTAAFAAHHLAEGAESVVIFVDKPPSDPLPAWTYKYPHRLRLILCDNDYWKDVHGIDRPNDHRKRQVLNANRAMNQIQATYVAHIDTDEFLYADAGVAKAICGLDDAVDVWRVMPAESVYTSRPHTNADVYDCMFKKLFPHGPQGQAIAHKIHGAYGSVLTRGLQGHTVGKLLVRNGKGLRVDIHTATRAEVSPRYKIHESLQLLHFFCRGPFDWYSKYTRRLHRSRFAAEPEKRQRQWSSLLKAASNGPNAIDALYNELNVLTDEAAQLLDQENLIIRPCLNIPERAVSYLDVDPSHVNKPLPFLDNEKAMNTLMKLEQSLTGATSPVDNPPSETKTLQSKAPALLNSSATNTLKGLLSQSSVYLEFGSGVSTELACSLHVPNIVTVETDSAFLTRLLLRCAAISQQSRLHAIFCNIGPTKEWGYPRSKQRIHAWHTYYTQPWQELNRTTLQPDVILVDGRFRVASFVYSYFFAKEGAHILFDDYKNRPRYHVVETIIKPSAMLGNTALFKKTTCSTTVEALRLVAQHAADPH